MFFFEFRLFSSQSIPFILLISPHIAHLYHPHTAHLYYLTVTIMINSPSHYLMVINDKIEIMLIIFYFKVLPSLLLIINMQVLLFLFCCFPFFSIYIWDSLVAW